MDHHHLLPALDALQFEIRAMQQECAHARRHPLGDGAARMADLAAELDALERNEERLMRRAEAAGLPVWRRDDARPEIVLSADADLSAG